MQQVSKNRSFRRLEATVLALAVATALAACGGGGDVPQAAVTASMPAPAASDTASAPAVAAAPADAIAKPTFHVAPVELDEPGDVDAVDNTASTREHPRMQRVPAEMSDVPTQRLTLEKVKRIRRERAQSLPGSATPSATPTVVSTYTPAQIRAAYGLPQLPAAGTTPTAEQMAQMGAGQTLYIVDAMHDPNAAAELAAFNSKFGLPGCATKAIAPGSVLPLAAAALADGCTFSVVYSTAAGAMTSTAPAYDNGWATEIALDVQWAHATAPYARIVLIETPDASVNSLTNAVKLANAMGPGVVSMSFGATEGSWTSSLDAAFTGSGMTYLAATGDWGTQVSWPAVSANVVGIGGTTLTWSGSGNRQETSWSSTGGGISAYTATPVYQSINVPGVGTLPRRGVADVGFNADPGTGQYTAVMAPGSSSASWLSAGGTSLATPQWAGLVAVANAMRTRAGKTRLAALNPALYGTIGAVPGTYAAAFADITVGSNGACATCNAGIGWDPLTGLGTPNATALLSALADYAVATGTAPVVKASTVAGTAGVALSFTAAATASNAVTWTLGGAPSGMSIASASGVVTWPSPVAGSYAVTAVATDTKTGLKGQGVYTVTIAAPVTAPVVNALTVNGTVGTALKFTVSVTSRNAVKLAMSGAPSGMTLSSAGVVSWALPRAGTYSVTVTATDSVTKLVGRGTYTVVIAQALPPAITASGFSGVAGRALAGTIQFADPNGYALSVSVSGVPRGMSFAMSGMTLRAVWASPVAGTYALAVTARNSAGVTTALPVPVLITK